MYGNDRTSLRRVFFDAWDKYRQSTPLTGIEQRLIEVILQHPEYHAVLENRDRYLDHDWSPDQGETNPFLHMSMHIALIEQISTDRPAGIRECHQKLTKSLGSPHQAEHRMMDCLSEAIWQAQRQNAMRIILCRLGKVQQCLGGLGVRPGGKRPHGRGDKRRFGGVQSVGYRFE